MRLFEDTLEKNKPYDGYVTDYSKVTYVMDREEIIFNTDQLKKDLFEKGYDNIHVSMILEAIHHHDGAIHTRINAL